MVHLVEYVRADPRTRRALIPLTYFICKSGTYTAAETLQLCFSCLLMRQVEVVRAAHPLSCHLHSSLVRHSA